MHYDPYYCTVDPEYIWSLIQHMGGAAQASMLGAVDFYVPKQLISMIMLLDPKLRILESKSYC